MGRPQAQELLCAVLSCNCCLHGVLGSWPIRSAGGRQCNVPAAGTHASPKPLSSLSAMPAHCIHGCFCGPGHADSHVSHWWEINDVSQLALAIQALLMYVPIPCGGSCSNFMFTSNKKISVCMLARLASNCLPMEPIRGNVPRPIVTHVELGSQTAPNLAGLHLQTWDFV